MLLLDSSLLQAGDIFLSAADGSVSGAIRFKSKSPFSHAMLYVADGSLIHSNLNGVHSENVNRLLFETTEQASVFRLKVADQRVIEEACVFARRQIGFQYSMSEAVKSVKRRNSDHDDESNRQFCSRLVAQAFAHAGLPLVKNANYCYPGDIAKSPHLVEIPTPMRPATKAEVEFASTDSPLELQGEITNRIFRKVRQLSSTDVQGFEQLVQLVISSPHLDAAISEIVEASGYLDMWKIDVQKNPWRYDPETFVQTRAPAQKLVETAKWELASAEEQLVQFQSNYLQYSALSARWSRQYFALESSLCARLIEWAKLRIGVARRVLEILRT